MIDAIGWRIGLCVDGHIHIQFIDKDEEVFAELILDNSEDAKQFSDDMMKASTELLLRGVN